MKKIPDNSILKKEFTIPFFNMKTMRKIFKRNKKKPKIYKRKRKTFGKLFAKNVLTSLLLTAIFAVGFFQFGRMWIFEKADSYKSVNMNHIRDAIDRNLNSENSDDKDISFRMRLYSGYSITLDDTNAKYQISTAYTKNCHVFSCIADEDGNIIYSSRMALQTYMRFKEEETMLMTCDTENRDIPELQQFEADYNEFLKKEKYDIKNNQSIETSITMKSAYVNREEKTFIPHEIEISMKKIYYNDAEPDEILETKEYNINIPEDYGYELVEFDLSGLDRYRISNDTYPRYFALGYVGTDREWFDYIKEKDTFYSDYDGGWANVGNNTRKYYQNAQIYIDGKPHVLSVILQIDVWNDVTKPLYFKIVMIFLLATLIIAFLDAWQRNVRNQADYMFEDYQKNLTNSLAHDLKTPLMAIGGYTENILSGSLSGEETDKYLKSIMDSVAYTDSIITRTLELNQIENSDKILKEMTDIRKVTENITEKYLNSLDEKNITLNISGHAEIKTNVRLFETIVENLVSNAVKYTPENGGIKIKIEEKSLSISNTVNKKVDISDIKKPFIKGDSARSNQSGSGLGLAIAEKSAVANDLKIDISCTDSEFRTDIIF